MKLRYGRDRIPCGSPKGWRDPETKYFIEYSCRENWEAFYVKVTAFYSANNRTAPSQDEVEDAICRQVPRVWCGEEVAPEPIAEHRPPPIRNSGGCSRCGKR